MNDAEMAKILTDHGYMVIKIPRCPKEGIGHGRHGLVTRTAICEGEEPIPHGFVSVHSRGILGGDNVSCQCGSSFIYYSGDPDCQWNIHKREFKICECIKSKVNGKYIVEKHSKSCMHPDAIENQ